MSITQEIEDTNNRIEIAEKIQERYRRMCSDYDLYSESFESTYLDLEAVGEEFPDADFQLLIDAPDDVFAHDIFGIKNNMQRDITQPGFKRLQNGFLPRFVSRSLVVAQASAEAEESEVAR